MKVNQYILSLLIVFSFCQNLVGQDYYGVKVPGVATSYLYPISTVNYIHLKNIKVDLLKKEGVIVEHTDLNPIYAIIEYIDGSQEIILKKDSLKEEKLSDYELITLEQVTIDTIVEGWLQVDKTVPFTDVRCCYSDGDCIIWTLHTGIRFKTQDYISIYQPKQEIPTSITEIKTLTKYNSELIAYPSPFKDKVTIFFDMPSIAKINLFDVKGSWIKNFQPKWADKFQTLNLSFLPSGVYILKIENQQGKIYNSKIVKH